MKKTIKLEDRIEKFIQSYKKYIKDFEECLKDQPMNRDMEFRLNGSKTIVRMFEDCIGDIV